MRRQVVRLGATVLVAMSALLFFGVAPAGAATKATVTLGPNDRIEARFGGFGIGASLALDEVLGITPVDCADGGVQATTCHYIPLRLKISNEELKKKKYALSFTLAWTPGQNLVIPATGTVPLTQLKLAVWDDPIVEDDDTPKTCDPAAATLDLLLCNVLGPVGGPAGGDEAWFDSFLLNEQPINFGMAPTRNSYGIVVADQYGLNSEFTLKIAFISSADVIDHSIDEPFADLSAIPVKETVGAGIVIPTLPTTTDLDLGALAPIGGDQDLDALALGGDDRLNLDAAEVIRGRNVREVRKPGDENSIALVFWLITLPLVITIGGTWWSLRRRSAAFS